VGSAACAVPPRSRATPVVTIPSLISTDVNLGRVG
jgi:hypothetical protein